MATNIAMGSNTTTSISVRAWYQGTPGARYCLFYCNGLWFATEDNGGSNTNWTTSYYTKGSLSPGTSYNFHAIFRDGAYNNLEITSTYSFSTNALPAPSAPSSISLSDRTVNSITVSWSTVSGATSYNVSGNGNTYNTTSNSYTFSGLSAGQSYSICVNAQNSSGTSGNTCGNFSTLQSALPPSTPTNLRYAYIRPNSFRFAWNAVSGATSYSVKLGSTGTVYTTSNTYYDFTGLNANQTYYPHVRANNSNGSSSYASTTVKTLTAIAFTVTNIGSTSISVQLATLDPSATFYFRVTLFLQNSVVYDNTQITSSTFTYTYIGLTPGQSYTVKAEVYNAEDQYEIFFDYHNVKTLVGVWDWQYPKVQGGDIYSVNGKNLIIMPASEWNNFTAFINTKRVSKGLSNYSFTSVSNGTNFTATIANQAVNALNDMLAVGNKISTVSSGNTITAAFFNNLRDKVNSIT